MPMTPHEMYWVLGIYDTANRSLKQLDSSIMSSKIAMAVTPASCDDYNKISEAPSG